MEKNNKIMAITIGIICFILVLTIFVQFKTVEETDISGIERMQETELKEALSQWKQKYEEANEKLEDTNEKIKEYSNQEQDKTKTSNLLQEELKNANMILGKTDVEGEGIEIIVSDGYKVEVNGNRAEQNVVAKDLVNLVNELKKAGAEAISINDQRVVNMTDIVDIGNNYILVNSQNVSNPYTIKAIGEKTYLQSALGIKNGYVDQMAASGKNVTVEAKRNIKILKYEAKTDKNKMQFKYIKEK